MYYISQRPCHVKVDGKYVGDLQFIGKLEKFSKRIFSFEGKSIICYMNSLVKVYGNCKF